jgi:DNA-directed RNA polymerase specialized sigma24 family protein
MDEIANDLDISVAAAKSRLHRARAMAREYLVG